MTDRDGTLRELVTEHRDAVLAGWLERILEAYPPEAARFLRTTGDPFGNPAGTALREELGTLLDGVLGAAGDGPLQSALDRIVRVRAVQEMTPSAAVGFVLELKPILEQVLGDSGLDARDELERLHRRVDRVVLAAFDVYSACREQVYEIRVRSIRELSIKRIDQLNDWRARRDGSDPTAAPEAPRQQGRSKEWVP
jgi:hypothetical protein